jgi:hypothetical protein
MADGGGRKMKCLECGHDLTIMYEYPVGFIPFNKIGNVNYWSYSHTEYKGHCKNCMRDWEWDVLFKDGKCEMTQPQRIFWG